MVLIIAYDTISEKYLYMNFDSIEEAKKHNKYLIDFREVYTTGADQNYTHPLFNNLSSYRPHDQSLFSYMNGDDDE